MNTPNPKTHKVLVPTPPGQEAESIHDYEDAMELYTEFMNVTYRSQKVIENMVAGKFTRVDDNTVSVFDDNNISVEINITNNEWDSMRSSLLLALPACPKDLEIECLKKEIESLNEERKQS